MKHIVKGAEPREFAEWKAQANVNWRPAYGKLRGKEKDAVRVALMKEQGFICCYCEQRLRQGDCHIDHLQPQNPRDSQVQTLPGIDALEFGNMLCSCQDRMKCGEPRHCGVLKGDWYHPVLFVSPLDPACESRFAFLGNGEIRPAQPADQGACETIKRLGLGIPKLNDMRQKAIEPFLDPSLTPDEIARFAAGYLQTDAAAAFAEFFTTIRYLFWSPYGITGNTDTSLHP